MAITGRGRRWGGPAPVLLVKLEQAHETRMALNLTEIMVIKKVTGTIRGKPEPGVQE